METQNRLVMRTIKESGKRLSPYAVPETPSGIDHHFQSKVSIGIHRKKVKETL